MTGLDLGGEYILARQELFDYDSGSLDVSFLKQMCHYNWWVSSWPNKGWGQGV